MSLDNPPTAIVSGSPQGLSIPAKPANATSLIVLAMVRSSVADDAVFTASMQGQVPAILAGQQATNDAACLAMIWNKAQIDAMTFPTTLDTFDDGAVFIDYQYSGSVALWVVGQSEDSDPVEDWGVVHNISPVSINLYEYTSGVGSQGALPLGCFANHVANRTLVGAGGNFDTLVKVTTGAGNLGFAHGPEKSTGGGWSGSFTTDIASTVDTTALFVLVKPAGSAVRAGSGSADLPLLVADGAGSAQASIPLITSIGGDGVVEPGEDAAYTATDGAGLTSATISNGSPAIVENAALSGVGDSGGTISVVQGKLPYTRNHLGQSIRGVLSANFTDGTNNPTISVDLAPTSAYMVISKPDGSIVTDPDNLWYGLDETAGNQLEIKKALSGGAGNVVVESASDAGGFILANAQPGGSYTLEARMWSVVNGEWGAVGTYTIDIPGDRVGSGSATLPLITANGLGAGANPTRPGSGSAILPALTATGSGVFNKFDNDPPVYQDGPTLVRFGGQWAELSATMDERCTRYGYFVGSGEAAPTAETIKANGSTAVMDPGVAKDLKIDGLPVLSSLDLYEIAEDPSGNVTAVQGPIPVETLSQGQIIVGARAPGGASADWETLTQRAGFLEEPPDYTFSGGRTSKKKSPYDGF